MIDFQADAVALWNTGEMAEDAKYFPNGGANPRDIKAIINREAAEIIGDIQRATSRSITIDVKQNTTDGITSEELDTGGDQIEFAVRYGQKPQRKEIGRIVSEDQMGMVLEMR